jgi:hypothetical protein
VGSGATGTPGSVVAPSSKSAPGAVPSTGTASGIDRHCFRDRGPFDLCFCHHKPYDVSTWGYDFYLRHTTSSRCTYLPLWWLRSLSGEEGWIPLQRLTGLLH